jgi:hypothetical protein
MIATGRVRNAPCLRAGPLHLLFDRCEPRRDRIKMTRGEGKPAIARLQLRGGHGPDSAHFRAGDNAVIHFMIGARQHHDRRSTPDNGET